MIYPFLARLCFHSGFCWEEKENSGPESDYGIASALASTGDHFLKSVCSYFPGQTLASVSEFVRVEFAQCPGHGGVNNPEQPLEHHKSGEQFSMGFFT